MPKTYLTKGDFNELSSVLELLRTLKSGASTKDVQIFIQGYQFGRLSKETAINENQ